MAQIRWDNLNPIAPNNSLANLSNDNFNKGISTIADSVRGFAQSARDQNTNALIREAMGIQDIAGLAEGRNTLMAMAENANNGADTLKALDALNKQESLLYARQNNINALGKHDRDLVREQGLDADRVRMNNPALIGQLLSGDKGALDSLPQFYDGSELINSYVKGRKEVKDDIRYNQDRKDKLDQQRFSNKLAQEDQDIQLSNFINPNPGSTTEIWEDDGKGGSTQTITTTPSSGDTFRGIARNRRADGSLDWGSLGDNKGGGATPKTSGSSPIAKAVNSNLQAFAHKMAPETAQAINKLGLNGDDKTLSMMIIESAGGGMGTDSGVAVGPMQLHKKYARDDAKRYGIKGDPLTNAEANIQTGMAKMKDLGNKFGGNADAIAIGYNGGENAARVAYTAWQNAGQKGRVADYIPSTYQSKGVTKKYDVKQMRDHALKYESAYNAMTQSRARKSGNQGAIASATAGSNIPNTIARPSASNTPASNATSGTGSFSVGGGAIKRAQQSLQAGLTSNEQAYNASNRGTSTLANKNALDLYMEDSGIKPGGSIWNSLFKDSQNTYNTLKENPEYTKLNAVDQKQVLKNMVDYVGKNQSLFGLNPFDSTITDRANREIQSIKGTKESTLDEKNFSALRSAAEKLISEEANRKNRTGKLPTIQQAMNMINPQLYNSMRAKDKEVDNPF